MSSSQAISGSNHTVSQALQQAPRPPVYFKPVAAADYKANRYCLAFAPLSDFNHIWFNDKSLAAMAQWIHRAGVSQALFDSTGGMQWPTLALNKLLKAKGNEPLTTVAIDLAREPINLDEIKMKATEKETQTVSSILLAFLRAGFAFTEIKRCKPLKDSRATPEITRKLQDTAKYVAVLQKFDQSYRLIPNSKGFLIYDIPTEVRQSTNPEIITAVTQLAKYSNARIRKLIESHDVIKMCENYGEWIHKQLFDAKHEPRAERINHVNQWTNIVTTKAYHRARETFVADLKDESFKKRYEILVTKLSEVMLNSHWKQGNQAAVLAKAASAGTVPKKTQSNPVEVKSHAMVVEKAALLKKPDPVGILEKDQKAWVDANAQRYRPCIRQYLDIEIPYFQMMIHSFREAREKVPESERARVWPQMKLAIMYPLDCAGSAHILAFIAEYYKDCLHFIDFVDTSDLCLRPEAVISVAPVAPITLAASESLVAPDATPIQAATAKKTPGGTVSTDVDVLVDPNPAPNVLLPGNSDEAAALKSAARSSRRS